MVSSVFVLLLVVAAASAIRYVDYRDLPRRRASLFYRALPRVEGEGENGGENGGESGGPAPQCAGPKKFCDGCQKVLFCDANNNTIPVATCKAPLTCNDGVCSATPTPKCLDIFAVPFECSSENVFPDPADCQVYHNCVGDDLDLTKPAVDHKRDCQKMNGQSYGFNPLTKVCDRKLVNNQCVGYPVPRCTAPGNTAALKDNNSCYYFCVEVDQANPTPGSDQPAVLYPKIYCCKNGGVYNPLNFSCSIK